MKVLSGRALATVGAAALALQGCSDSNDAEGTASTEASDETLAAMVADTDGLSTVSDALDEAGIAQVFEGAAAYTLFAPQDGAFDKLGEVGDDLRSPEQRAAMVAILRDHIVPGYLTPDDIANAVEQADDGSVEMRTMGDHTLTFTGEGDTITVTAEDGSTAAFAGDALRGSNGVAIPLDGVLKKVTAPAAAG